ncbi:MAG: DUF3769 domain-containing protein [Gomphosphaeria aponina SAG 52.96 = DSM 107014]|uniref:DUF3769 domain-containing protein n=1 Tax=Gomphosphaeria aponina SAG 52.96 = DSM 107014 TaxID=1521640 RepID=A0A941GSU9_9CHRO|nr:DUF3769 domain-containing protein [Gomphosphaeria aponina SAG 52.96 = DSM 107014]
MPPILPPPEPPVIMQVVELNKSPKPWLTNKDSNQPRGSAELLGSPISVKYSAEAEKKIVTRLVTQERNGESREFEFAQKLEETVAPAAENLPRVEEIKLIEVIAERQEYDQKQQVITATGNVVMRFDKGVLRADRLRVNLAERLAIAEGQVILERGEQVLRGERFEYYFVQDRGVIKNASGEVYQPTISRDVNPSLPTDTGTDTIPEQPLSDRLNREQPLQRVTTAAGYRFVVGSIRDLNLIQQQGGVPSTQSGGRINRFRFQAERIQFEGDGWEAINVRLTNDPFSPPELEVRASTATLRNISPLVDELITTNSRLVFDQTLSLPLLQDKLVFDNRPRRPGLFSIGFDGEERGGLFIERGFNIVDTDKVIFNLTPQYFLQKAFFGDGFSSTDGDESNQDDDCDGGVFNPCVFGVKTEAAVNLGTRTSLFGTTQLTSLNLENIENRLRSKVQLQQKVGDLNRPHTVNLEYNYRERLFNGSLGFQTVHSSFGAIVTSPIIPLGETGINISYQASMQNIEAVTDREDLLSSNRDNDRVNLSRYQGAVSLRREFPLWRGEALPATAEAGLRYTSTPVLPYLQFTTGITGVASGYSNGDTQNSLSASIGLQGQLGHFSRSYFDYTGFNVTFSQGILGGESPFKFDRFVDEQTLSLGITQQIYGPVRAGLQTAFNLDRDREISTDYFLEFSRRTYNIILRYNPVLQIGSLNLRISDFNWNGNTEPFEGSGINPVIQGVTR